MRWPWKRSTAPLGEPQTDIAEAAQARRKAEEALAKAHHQSGEVDRVVARSKWNRRDDHFAELVARTFQGGK